MTSSVKKFSLSEKKTTSVYDCTQIKKNWQTRLMKAPLFSSAELEGLAGNLRDENFAIEDRLIKNMTGVSFKTSHRTKRLRDDHLRALSTFFQKTSAVLPCF